jgi:hypothetical protein
MMKRFTIEAVLLLAGTLLVMGQGRDTKTYNASHSNTATATAVPGATCLGKEGNTCTDGDLKALGQLVGKRRHQPVSLTLGKGGALLCDKTPCQPDQLKDVTAEAAPLGLKIVGAANSTSSRSNTQHN